MAVTRACAAVALVGAALLAGCGGTPVARQTPSQPAPGASAALGTASPPSTAPAAPTTVPVPAGVTAGIAVYDRQRGAFVVEQRATTRFRSASLVKLLVVLDYLWNRGPDYAIPAADRARLDLMLRSSDDAAASYFWRLNGSGQLVTRMVARLGLQDTAPPPAARPSAWGYTAVSAADLVRVYRYLLDTAPAPVREYVMGNLHQATRCGTDRYDQSFGIPSAFRPPRSAKQGWSGFGDRPANPCTASAASVPGGVSGPGGPIDVAWTEHRWAAPVGPNFVGEVLHTTGTVGAGDRSIVAVLTLHPDGTAYPKAAATLTALTRTLPVPGAVLVG